jgi:menaquinol-cytochrome c reductase iron-sulfur subunit
MKESNAEPPQPCREPTPEEITRRKFLERTSIALAALGAAIVTLPLVGFIFAPLFRKEPAVWRTVGTVGNFKIGETSEVTFLDSSPLPWAGVTAKTAAWLRRTGEQDFIAFAITCSHLGCPVRWQPSARLFMCPCHGGVYYEDGSVAAGPPPRPLTRYSVRIQNDEVQIETKPVVVVRRT